MAFEVAQNVSPARVGDIEIRLYSPNPDSDDPPHAAYSVEVYFSDGSRRMLHGDLSPHLTQQQINGLLSFMDALRTQANAQILPD